MVPSSGVKVLHWFARRSLSSNLLEDSSNSLCKKVIRQSCRNFSAGNRNPHKFIGNYAPGTAHHRNWLVLGFLNANLGASRSIHGTGVKSARDYYEVLGVSNDATDGEIKKAYYGLAKKLHPDTNKEDPETEKKFQEVSKAYEVLKNKETRSVYDQVGHEAFEQQASGGSPNDAGFGEGFNPFDIFGNFNGDIFNMFRRDMGGQDVKVAIELSFMEAVQGCSKTVSFQTEVPCEACGGQGIPPGAKREKCWNCNGLGMTTITRGMLTIQNTCSKCGGAGQVFSSICRTCKGAKVVKGSKSVKLDIKPGVDNNETIKVFRCGGADPDGDQPGDLYVTIKVREDPVFRREGADIHVDAVINVTQAMLGGTIQVPTLTGDVVVKVRPGTQPGQKVFLRNKGVRTRNANRFGDQYVHFNISIPTNLSQRQRELIEEFAKEEQSDYEKCAAAGASR